MTFPAFRSLPLAKRLPPAFKALLACLALLLPGLPAIGAQLILHGPAGSGAFGARVVVLPNGNFVVADPAYSIPGGAKNVGAVYLYSRAGTLISTLTGSSADDQVGSTLEDGGNVSIFGISSTGIVVLSNGNFVINSNHWNNGAGAVTWGSATTGVNGVVSAANSLTGSMASDQVGIYGVTPLTNGGYVVSSPAWNGTLGAATWGSGTTGISGAVSAANSLVGTTAGDQIGQRNSLFQSGNNGSGVTALSDGSYVICSPLWNQKRGAATWGNGATGISGPLSAANSLVGSTPSDRVGDGGALVLAAGSYLVSSPYWSNGTAKEAGAVTWGGGGIGVAGMVSATNSLVGSNAGDAVGSAVVPVFTVWGQAQSPIRKAAIVVLKNGNYVAGSPAWNNYTGAVTWGSGSTGVAGTVSATNSLVGASAGDRAGYGDSSGSGLVTPLTNGHYVVSSPDWNGFMGAVTWGDGIAGSTGMITAGNSLTGSKSGDSVGSDGITALANGNYVVASGEWNHDTGAATWRSGTSATGAVVSAINSLVGSDYPDQVGVFGIIPLRNGNYVVYSPDWNHDTGAVTWGNGTTGTSGAVSLANSLIGTSQLDHIGGGGVIALTNGNYVVGSPAWNSGMGAATWADGSVGVSGVISTTGSLTGSVAGDQVGDQVGGRITALSNGNYVVTSSNWNNGAGAVTWGNGLTGVSGKVAGNPSLVGSTPLHESSFPDHLGSSGVVALGDGNYLVSSGQWNDSVGAVTWGNGATGSSGQVSATNSLVGSTPGDSVGTNQTLPSITTQTDGSYVVSSPNWIHGDALGAGAVTFCASGGGTTGFVGTANSVLGTFAYNGGNLKFGCLPSLNELVVGNGGGNAVTLFQPGPGVLLLTVATGGNSEASLPSGSSAAFGNTLLKAGQDLTFTLVNTGDTPLTRLTFRKSGADQAMFNLTTRTAASLAPGDRMSFTVRFAPSSTGDKTAALHILGNEATQPLFDIVLTGTGVAGVVPTATTLAATDPGFGGATLHGLVNCRGAGQVITFDYGTTTDYGGSVTAGESPLSGSSPAPVSAVLTGLLPHTTYHYRVRATRSDGEGFVAGASFTFTTANHPPGTVADTFQALPSSSITLDVLANDIDVDGDTLSIASFTQPGREAGMVTRAGGKLVFTPSSTFSNASFTYVAADAFGGKSPATAVYLHRDGTFSCPGTLSASADQGASVLSPIISAAPFTVTGAPSWLHFQPIQPGSTQVTFVFSPNPSTNTRTATIQVGGQAVIVTQASASAPPMLSVPATVSKAVVGTSYDLAVPTQNGPVTYTTSGLPRGLTLSDATGHITGFPVAARTYSVSVIARNALGVSNQITFPLQVQPFPAALLGGWSATVDRNAAVNNGLGGLVVLNVAAGGSVTGTVKCGATTHPFIGRLDTSIASTSGLDYAQLRLALPHSPLVLAVNFNSNYEGGLDGSLSLGPDTAAVSGWQHYGDTDASDMAPSFAGRYTAALNPSTDDPAVPQGSGFLLLTIDAKLTVTWSGRLADGTLLASGTSALTRYGGAPLYTPLYGGKGSLIGTLTVPSDTPGSPGTNELVGDLFWSKQPGPGRSYGGGFGLQYPVDLTIVGGGYVPPARGTAVLPGAVISLAGGGIEVTSMASNFKQVISISASNIATLPAIKPGNPANIRITGINATLGTFIGSFTLVDPSPFGARLPPVSREAPFAGVLLQGINLGGTGFFLLPSVSGPPVNVTTSPLISGQVTLTPQ